MSRIRPSKFAHVVYRTRQFEEMLAWYQLVFDARIQHHNPALAFLSFDEEHHRFAIVDLEALRPGEDQTTTRDLSGVDHVAYTYASLSDLFTNYELLKENDILPYWCVHHGVTISMYYADPDGNQIEFQVDAFASSMESVEFIRSPRFAANPIGVEYDPEDWLARMRDGAPESEFLVRSSDEPISPIRGALAM